jgi:hypothetical protein
LRSCRRSINFIAAPARSVESSHHVPHSDYLSNQTNSRFELSCDQLALYLRLDSANISNSVSDSRCESMSTEKPLRCVPPDIQALFGDAPLLSTEDPGLYWEMLDRFAASVEPTNVIEWLWVKDVADLSWEIARLRRYRALLIESRRKSQNARVEYEREHAEDPDVYLSHELSPEEIEARRSAPRLDTEGDSANLFCELLFRYEPIDKLLISAELRRDRILRELDFRRERIASLLRKTSDQLIDARSDAVPLAVE